MHFWNALIVIWNASSVNIIHVKGELECIWCSKLKNFEGPLKIIGRVKNCLNV
jgi:hypothetical protein